MVAISGFFYPRMSFAGSGYRVKCTDYCEWADAISGFYSAFDKLNGAWMRLVRKPTLPGKESHVGPAG
jgi:hypothetical protein